jgi:hypothetical protein
MGRIQRRDQTPQQYQNSAPFEYIDRRAKVEHERVAETVYDEHGQRRAVRYGWRERTEYEPLPNLRGGPGIGAAIGRWVETLWAVVAGAMAIAVVVSGAALAYTWANDSWGGIAIYCVLLAGIAILAEHTSE